MGRHPGQGLDDWTSFTVAAYYDRATLLKLLWSSTDIVEALRTWEERQALSIDIMNNTLASREESVETNILRIVCDCFETCK